MGQLYYRMVRGVAGKCGLAGRIYTIEKDPANHEVKLTSYSTE